MSYIGTNKPIAIADYSEASPIGTLIYFAGTQAPPGYLACQGQEVAQSAYPELYAAIGDTWNNTNGAPNPQPGNFRLPPGEVDGLGLYLRNTGATNGGVGTYQIDVFKEHNHIVEYQADYDNTLTAGGTRHRLRNAGGGNGTVSSYNTGDPTETRPRTITTLLCIKATYSRYLGDIGGVPANSVGEGQLVDEITLPSMTGVSYIIESGNNTNGQFIKYADGTLICEVANSTDPSVDKEWVFPYSFLNNPRVFITPLVDTNEMLAASIAYSTLSTTSCFFSGFNSVGRAPFNVSILAIGKWR